MLQIARSSLITKVNNDLVDVLTPIVTDAVLTVKHDDHPLDLHMIEIITMQHGHSKETELIKGLVLTMVHVTPICLEEYQTLTF